MEPVMKFAKWMKVPGGTKPSPRPRAPPPPGYLPVYVGEERERFIIPANFLSHPLFSMLLEKASMEYGFEQRNGLSFPCTVPMFQEVVNAVRCSRGQFNLEKFVEEFVGGGEYGKIVPCLS